jgi:hypothetical protein
MGVFGLYWLCNDLRLIFHIGILRLSISALGITVFSWNVSLGSLILRLAVLSGMDCLGWLLLISSHRLGGVSSRRLLGVYNLSWLLLSISSLNRLLLSICSLNRLLLSIGGLNRLLLSIGGLNGLLLGITLNRNLLLRVTLRRNLLLRISI